MAGSPRVDGRSLRYQHRRPELLAAALEYVLEHGPGDLSLRSMAGELGVSHATLLRHFVTKEALLTAVFEHLREQTIAELENDDELRAAAPVEKLRLMWQRLCRPRRRRQFVVLAETYGLARREPERYRAGLEATVYDWLALVEQGLADEAMSGDDARVAATMILAQIRGLQLDLAATGDHERVDRAFELFVSGLGRANPSSGTRR
ncbi:TetR/AcrR family transcriptional regulator [Actinomycetospora atypica]|uniref:TetR/AcrR family transcriptional regulator n=1 Tax=Actinomycetospora atypica TaxID=1290095 RepID=A0ABV9YKF1_9PSEU